MVILGTVALETIIWLERIGGIRTLIDPVIDGSAVSTWHGIAEGVQGVLSS